MKLIKKINRVVEEMDTNVVADLDQKELIDPEDKTRDNIKEVEKREGEDLKTIQQINGKSPKDPLEDVKPLKEDMEEATLLANQIQADAQQKASEVLAAAAQEEVEKQAELAEIAKEDLRSNLISDLIQEVWDLVDKCQNALTTLKANEVEDINLNNILNEITTQEYIHVGELEGLFKQDSIEEPEEVSKEDVIADTVDDELATDGEAEEEPDPVDIDDLDGFHADLEVEEDTLDDGEPAAIEVTDDDLQ